MTREETAEALKICNSANGDCRKCPFKGIDDCVSKMQKSALKYLVAYDENTKRQMNSGTTAGGTEIIDKLKKLQKFFAKKKRAYRPSTSLYQYWSGKEEATKQIMEILQGGD